MKCQVHESRLISINVDERKSTRAGVSEVDQINRDQPRSIALKPSIRLATECSGRRSEIGGIQVAEASALFGRFPEIKKRCHKNLMALSDSGGRAG
jgi:hypothetical protein